MLCKAKGVAGLLAAAALMFQAGGNVAYASEATLTGTDPLTVRAERGSGGAFAENGKSKDKRSGDGDKGKDKGGTHNANAAGTKDGTDNTHDGTGNTNSKDGKSVQGQQSGRNDNTNNTNTGTNSASKETAAKEKEKVTLCHRTGSASNPWVLITVSKSAWKAHEAHGDVLLSNGSCPAAVSDGDGTAGGGQPATNVAGQESAPETVRVVVIDSHRIDMNVTLRINGEDVFLPAGTQLITTNLGTSAVLPSGETLQLGVVAGMEAVPAAPAAAAPAAEAGQQASTAPGAASLGIANLPATSSVPPSLPLGALGASATALGLYLLRRRR